MSVKFIRGDQIIDSGECLRDLNLLAHAQLIELEIGSSCGGYGKCAGDRVVLSEKDQAQVNPPTEVEQKHFSKSELARGLRLACQCFPNESGMTISAKLSPLSAKK
jgi:ferredoxin